MQIRELRLATTALDALHAFYGTILGLPVVEDTPTGVAFQVGTSRLVFEQVEAPIAGVYHFAFNIPENQFTAARQWLAERVPLLANSSGETVFHSTDWNADMVYFADPAGNIGELIVRHTLDNATDMPFGSDSMLNVSEIGVAAEDVPAQVADLQTRIGAEPYGSGDAMFAPVGDEHGLLIVVRRGRIWFPDTGMPANHVPMSLVVDSPDGAVQLVFPSQKV